MVQKRKHFPKQFKIDAVKLVTEQGYKISEAARNLGIQGLGSDRDNTLKTIIKKYK